VVDPLPIANCQLPIETLTLRVVLQIGNWQFAIGNETIGNWQLKQSFSVARNTPVL
jgi:hypothetical protein